MTLRLEVGVSNRQDLIDHQNLRVHVHRDGESEPHEHAGRVVFHRGINELLQISELDDRVNPLGHGLAIMPVDAAIQIDVIPPGKLWVESCAELQHRMGFTGEDDLAAGRLEDPGNELEQRTLSRAVAPQHSE
jgi:hypothetical protein